MFIPIGDSPNPPQRPYMTWLLIGLNVFVYLAITLPASFRQVNLNDPVLFDYLRTLGLQGRVSAQQVLQHVQQYDLLVFSYGFRPADFSLVSLLVSLFLHGGFFHLAGNMLFLYIFGDNVEYRLGPVRYLCAYLGCGVLATLFFAVFALDSQVPLIGASGAIFGVLGSYFVWFPKNRVRCFLFLFPFITTNIYLPARLVLGFYLVIDNVLPFIVTGSAESGIAHGAHIGGFIGGVGLAGLLNRTAANWCYGRNQKDSKRGDGCESYEADTVAAVQQEVPNRMVLNDRWERQKIASGDLLRIGDSLLESGHLDEALRLYKRFVAERPTDPDLAQAYLGAGKVLYQFPRQRNIAYQYFLSARELARSEVLTQEAKSYLRRIEGA